MSIISKFSKNFMKKDKRLKKELSKKSKINKTA